MDYILVIFFYCSLVMEDKKDRFARYYIRMFCLRMLQCTFSVDMVMTRPTISFVLALMIFTNNLDPDQDRRSVDPDLDLNRFAL